MFLSMLPVPISNNMTEAFRTFLQLSGSTKEIQTRPDFQSETFGLPDDEQCDAHWAETKSNVRTSNLRYFYLRYLTSLGGDKFQSHEPPEGDPSYSVRICSYTQTCRTRDNADEPLPISLD